MRRAVEVYQKYIVERFTAQKTDYQQLLKVWAEGFYRYDDHTPIIDHRPATGSERHRDDGRGGAVRG